MDLTKERKGEIADRLITEVLKDRKPAILSSSEFKTKTEELSKKIDVSKEELALYLKGKLTDLFTEMFDET